MLGVPKKKTLGSDMLVNEATDSRTEGLFLFRALRRKVSLRDTPQFVQLSPIHIRYLSRHKHRNDIHEITGTYQYGDWRHVERAAPIPVPVQIRIPRLYSVDVFDTPANWKNLIHEYNVFRESDVLNYLKLTSPESFRWV